MFFKELIQAQPVHPMRLKGGCFVFYWGEEGLAFRILLHFVNRKLLPSLTLLEKHFQRVSSILQVVYTIEIVPTTLQVGEENKSKLDFFYLHLSKYR